MKNETESLNDRIIYLENKRSLQQKLIKEQFHNSIERLKPLNLIKNTFQEINSPSKVKNILLKVIIGIGTGTLTKKILVRGSHNPIKQLAGSIIEFSVANKIFKNADDIKLIAENLFRRFQNHRKD